jgi:hypothetical protein
MIRCLSHKKTVPDLVDFRIINDMNELLQSQMSIPECSTTIWDPIKQRDYYKMDLRIKFKGGYYLGASYLVFNNSKPNSF